MPPGAGELEEVPGVDAPPEATATDAPAVGVDEALAVGLAGELGLAVGVGFGVGRGVGVGRAVGGGVGVGGGGGAVTVTGGAILLGLFWAVAVAVKVKVQVPAGSFRLVLQIPSAAVPEIRESVTVRLAATACTAVASLLPL